MDRLGLKWGILLLLHCLTTTLSAECKIDSLVYEMSDCLESEFFIFLNFQHDSTTGEGFIVAGNGKEYGSYAYEDLPVKIGPLTADGETNYEFVVTDKGNPQCTDFIEVGSISCGSDECAVENLAAEVSKCHGEGIYDVIVDFNPVGFESFDIYIDGEFAGFFHQENLPVTIGEVKVTDKDLQSIEVCANDREDCCASKSFPTPICEDTVCGMKEVVVKPVECDSGGYYVKIDFFPSGSHADSFLVIRGNGISLGTFAYDDLPIFIGQFTHSDSALSLKICDSQNMECSFTEEVEGICHCILDEFILDAGECSGDSTLLVEIDFQTKAFEKFSLFTDEVFVGEFLVEELPLRLDDFPFTGNHHPLIKLISETEMCQIEKIIEVPICGQGGCISDLIIESTECDEDQFFLEIDFSHPGSHSDFFRVRGNGNEYGKFAYAELPITIGPLKADGITEYEIGITDIAFDDCRIARGLGRISCNSSCLLNEINLDVGKCTSDSTYTVGIDFESEGRQFSIYANEVFVGSYEISELPLIIDDFPTSGDEVDFLQICVDDSLCCDYEVLVPECLHHDCFVDIGTEITDCDSSNQFYFWLDFNHVGMHSSSFYVKGNGQELRYQYRDLPVKVGPFPGGEEFYRFKVVDELYESCNADLVIGRVVCDRQCDISILDLVTGECLQGDRYNLEINKVETAFNGLDFYLNGKWLGFFTPDQLPTVVEVNRGENETDLFRVCISDNEECCSEMEILPPQCQDQCEVSDLTADTTRCKNDSFYVKLDFSYEEVSDAFYIKGNGVEYGLFGYDQLPLLIGPLAADQKTVYEFAVVDSIYEDCQISLELGQVSCPEEAQIGAERELIILANDERIHLRVPDFFSDPTQVAIFNVQGHHLVNRVISSSSDPVILNLTNLHLGMHILHLRSTEGRTHNEKFIIH